MKSSLYAFALALLLAGCSTNPLANEAHDLKVEIMTGCAMGAAAMIPFLAVGGPGFGCLAGMAMGAAGQFGMSLLDYPIGGKPDPSAVQIAKEP